MLGLRSEASAYAFFFLQLQRKVAADPGSKAEEGRATSLVYSSNFTDSESETRRRPPATPSAPAIQYQVHAWKGNDVSHDT